MSEEYSLPPIITLEKYHGMFDDFFEAVYQVFKRDFVDSKPVYSNKPLRLKTHPYIDGKEYTFYHMTHSGDIEEKREPDLRRMERIGWAKPVIENHKVWRLKVWEQKRKGKKRICIWMEIADSIDYIVILDVRINYILPWTTFVLQYRHEKRKKQREYEAYLKARTA